MFSQWSNVAIYIIVKVHVWKSWRLCLWPGRLGYHHNTAAKPNGWNRASAHGQRQDRSNPHCDCRAKPSWLVAPTEEMFCISYLICTFLLIQIKIFNAQYVGRISSWLNQSENLSAITITMLSVSFLGYSCTALVQSVERH